MVVKLKQRKGRRGTSLFLAWWANGKWNYEFLKMRLIGEKLKDRETLRLAEKIRLNREEELESAGRGLAPSFKRKMSIIQFYENLDKTGQNWRTLKHHLSEFPAARVAVSSVNESWARDFREFLLSRLSANSARVIFATMKAALRYAVKEKILSQNPAAFVTPIKSTEIETQYLTSAEVKRLAATRCIDPELKRAFLFCCHTGLRISDVKALKWENYQDGKLRYRQKKTKGFEYLELPKDGPADRLLSANKSNLPFIFKFPGDNSVSRYLKRWAKAADIKKDLHFHMSRHTAATLMLERGVDLYTVSKVLGHKDISTTQRYAKVVDAKKREALASLPDIDFNLEPAAADVKKIEKGDFRQAR